MALPILRALFRQAGTTARDAGCHVTLGALSTLGPLMRFHVSLTVHFMFRLKTIKWVAGTTPELLPSNQSRTMKVSYSLL